MPRSLLPTVSHLSGEEEEPWEQPTIFFGKRLAQAWRLRGSAAEDAQPRHPNHNPGGITLSMRSHMVEKR